MSSRTTFVTATAALVAALAAALLGLAPAEARAASNCGDAVLAEWSKGGIHRPYPLRCYGEALRRMPQDIRSYSTATDDIQRALLARQRKAAEKRDAEALGAAPASASRSSSAVPVPLVVLGALGLALILAAAVRGSFALRRLRRRS
jgi:hypothetical protein